jgi:hypothetical protein
VEKTILIIVSSRQPHIYRLADNPAVPDYRQCVFCPCWSSLFNHYNLTITAGRRCVFSPTTEVAVAEFFVKKLS